MFIDKQNTFSTAQAVTASAASTDYIDLGAIRDLGHSHSQIMIKVDTTATAAGAATVQFQVQADPTLTTFGSPVVVAQTDAIGKATLVAGAQFFLKIPQGSDARALRVYYNVGTGPLTAGAFSAAVVEGVQKNKAYPDAI